MKVAFSTWCTDDYVDRVGLHKLLNSTKYFHPDIPHYVIDSKQTDELKQTDPWLDHYYMMPPTCMSLAEEYDLVIHLDGDCVVTGTLDDILEADYDVAGVRNNNDYMKAGKDDHITIHNPATNTTIHPFEFLNAGLVASTSKQFWKDWHELNKVDGMNHAGHENDTLNILFHSGKYKTKILDPFVSNVSYGINNAWGTETHWDSWKDIYVQNNKIYLTSPTGTPIEIKVLHVAGGCNSPQFKQNYEQYGFDASVLQFLSQITS